MLKTTYSISCLPFIGVPITTSKKIRRQSLRGEGAKTRFLLPLFHRPAHYAYHKQGTGLFLCQIHTNDLSLPLAEFKSQSLVNLQTASCIIFKKKMVKSEVMVLDITEERLLDPASRPADINSKHGSSESNKEEMIYLNQQLEIVLRDLEEEFGVPFILKDPSYGSKKVDMSIPKGGINDLSIFLKQKFGIELKKKKRKIEFVEISRKS